ncbi:MAG: hypothetical protein NVSMB19_22080 [Vulcanimicrobiaceae bacterium]
MSFNAQPQGGPPTPQGSTVDYAVKSTLSSSNGQSQLTFQGGSADGFLTIPFATTSTYTLYVYVPALAGNSPLVKTTATVSNGRFVFNSPFNQPITLPLPTTVYLYFTRP